MDLAVELQCPSQTSQNNLEVPEPSLRETTLRVGCPKNNPINLLGPLKRRGEEKSFPVPEPECRIHVSNAGTLLAALQKLRAGLEGKSAKSAPLQGALQQNQLHLFFLLVLKSLQ